MILNSFILLPVKEEKISYQFGVLFRALLTAIVDLWNHDERTIRITAITTVQAVLADADSLQNGIHPLAKTVGKHFLLLLRNGMPNERLLTAVGALARSMPTKTAIQLAERVTLSCRNVTGSVRV